MGLYDDDDANVTRVSGGWLAASQQANKFKIQQQKRDQEIRFLQFQCLTFNKNGGSNKFLDSKK